MCIEVATLIWIRSVRFEIALLVIRTGWTWVHILEQPWSLWTELLLHEIRLQNALVSIQPTSGMLDIWKSNLCFPSTAKGIIKLSEILGSTCRQDYLGVWMDCSVLGSHFFHILELWDISLFCQIFIGFEGGKKSFLPVNSCFQWTNSWTGTDWRKCSFIISKIVCDWAYHFDLSLRCILQVLRQFILQFSGLSSS